MFGKLLERFSETIEVHFLRDRIRLVSRKTGEVLERDAAEPFSSPALLIADETAAARLLGAMIREMFKSARFGMWPKALVFIAEPSPGGLNMIEKRAIAKMVDDVGFSAVSFAD